MIAFSCRCGFEFEVPAELQGEPIQCPECGLLNDVPSPADLVAIDADGAFKLDDAPLDHQQGRLNEQLRYFGGKEDVRHNVDEFLDLGIDETFRRDEANARPFNIDPWTGEAVTPIPLNETPKPVLPINFVRPIGTTAPSKTLDYARNAAGTIVTAINPWRVPRELLLLGNLTVLFMLLITHNLFQLTACITFGGFIFVFFMPIFFAFALIGHWANVADETGPAGNDHLPTLLRSVSVGDDILRPFVAVAIALFICFVPAIWWLLRAPIALPFHVDAWALAFAGLVFFPAVMLTTATSGSLLNLLPHHVLRVMTVAPRAYFGLLCLALATAVFYVVPCYFIHVYWVTAGDIMPVTALTYGIVGSPVLLFGLFVASWFAWALGLFYRGYHKAFNWAYQEHIRVGRDDTNSRLEQMNRNRRGATANVPTTADARRGRMAVQDAETRRRQVETAEALKNLDMGRTNNDLSTL